MWEKCYYLFKENDFKAMFSYAFGSNSHHLERTSDVSKDDLGCLEVPGPQRSV